MSFYKMPAPSTSGNVLTSDGSKWSSAAPSSATVVLISSQTASTSSSIDFTSLSTGTYSTHMIIGYNIVPATNAVNLLMRFSVSGTFDASNYGWQNWRWTTAGQGVAGQSPVTASGIALNAAGSDNLANSGTNAGMDFTLYAYNLGSTTYTKKVSYHGFYFGSALLGVSGAGVFQSTSAVDGIRFLMDSGNITSGTFNLYGIK